MAENAETAAQLKALGYAAGTVRAPLSGALPDPKARIGALRDFSEAMELTQKPDYAQAAEKLRQLTVENPSMVDAWDLLGDSLRHLGQLDEALAAYRKAMEISGGTPHLAISTGMLLLEMGELDDAAAHARMALAINPAAAHSLLASVAEKKGDYATAEREAKLSLEAGGSKIGPLLVLANTYRDQNRLDEALAMTEQAMQSLGPTPPKYQGLYLARGDIFARLGRLEDAVAAFRSEIDRFPEDPRAYSRLAALLVAAEHPQEAGTVLQEMLARNPNSPVVLAAAVRSMRVLGDPDTAQRLLAEARHRFPDDKTLAKL
jgi:predicted Zn-dependent protease